MQDQETALRVELVSGVTTEIGRDVVERLEAVAKVPTYTVEATLGDEGVLVFDLDLEIDRPVAELIDLARANIPSSVSVLFTIWRYFEDDGVEIAHIFGDPLPGLFND
ncbi:hypothetical protein [Tropicibacter alexandrii]|uniref:hypothetical protein n=1 Tax=Tropicibacter alexandrii TaxID=2267683 RepID=UPI000EF4B58D|nr:hypothetical protein [Tropicibacter alexandrii]